MTPPRKPRAARLLALRLLAGAVLAGAGLAAACQQSPSATAPAEDTAAAEAQDGVDTARLRSLPYGRWVPLAGDPQKALEGVVRHDRERAWPGLNLLAPRHLTRAFLVDMDGRVVHHWQRPRLGGDGWHHVEPLPGGDLVALVKDGRLTRLGPGSEVRWQVRTGAHHDAEPTPGGDLWVPTRELAWIERGGERLPVLDDGLTLHDGDDGRALRRIRLLPLFGDHVTAETWQALGDWFRAMDPAEREELGERRLWDSPADLFHLNSVEVIPRDVRGPGPDGFLARAGDLLVSIRQIHTVAVIDAAGERVRWSWGRSVLERQHHATLLDDGHVLLFDNGPFRGWSRVVEVDPASGEIAWEYRGTPPESFFSGSRGAAQRLPNGNTLITESDAGRVFEVTPAGEIVWELLGPVAGEPPRRAALYRVRRLPPEGL